MRLKISAQTHDPHATYRGVLYFNKITGTGKSVYQDMSTRERLERHACNHFKLGGSGQCARIVTGHECGWLHLTPQNLSEVDNSAKAICPFYLMSQGCKFGASCFMEHSDKLRDQCVENIRQMAIKPLSLTNTAFEPVLIQSDTYGTLDSADDETNLVMNEAWIENSSN